jgi:hypothetical protein
MTSSRQSVGEGKKLVRRGSATDLTLSGRSRARILWAKLMGLRPWVSGDRRGDAVGFPRPTNFRIEGLEVSLHHAREIAVRAELDAVGITLKKRKDTWLKFGSCIKKPWMSSAERRENKPVWASARVTTGGEIGRMNADAKTLRETWDTIAPPVVWTLLHLRGLGPRSFSLCLREASRSARNLTKRAS